MILLSLWIAASLGLGALWALAGSVLSSADRRAPLPVPVRPPAEPMRQGAERVA